MWLKCRTAIQELPLTIRLEHCRSPLCSACRARVRSLPVLLLLVLQAKTFHSHSRIFTQGSQRYLRHPIAMHIELPMRPENPSPNLWETSRRRHEIRTSLNQLTLRGFCV